MPKSKNCNRPHPGNAFRWIGGKNRIMPRLLLLFPDHRCYVSVFGSSGADILGKPRSEMEVFNDLNSDVVNVFRVLRDERLRKQLCLALEFTPYSRREYVYCLDLLHSTTGSLVERAWAFQVATTFGYGGKDPALATPGSFTINPKMTSSRRYCRASEQLLAVSQRFRQVVVENLDWKAVVEKYDASDTLFYLDPPYVLSSRVAQKIYAHELQDSDHDNLVNQLQCVEGLVILSGYANPIYDNALANWRRVEFQTRCTVSPKKKKPARTEVVWMNCDRHGNRLSLNPTCEGKDK